MRLGRMLTAALVGVLIAPLPAVAAPAAPHAPQIPQVPPTNRQCADPGGPAPQVPWHQRAFDPQRVGVLSRGSDVKVAVIDSGVDATHPQLRGRVQAGRDLLFPGGGPGNFDCTGHGTAVASIIAGGGESGAGFRGYAPGVQIVPFVVSEQGSDKGEAGPGTAANFAAAIQAAIAEKVDVINVSLALYEDDAGVRGAIAQAVAADIVVVASVGSASDNPELANRTPYPAAYPNVIGVGAIGQSGLRSSSSPVGTWIDLMAPGEQVAAAARGSGYGTYSGTGIAAPFVSAAAALVRARTPSLSAGEVANRLYASSDPAPGGGDRSVDYGRGIVNAYHALADYPVNPSPAVLQPVQVYRGDEVDPVRQRQIRVAYSVGVGMIALVIIAGAAAVWMPRGRLRRWRPGRAAPVPERALSDGNRRLFDDLEDG